MSTGILTPRASESFARQLFTRGTDCFGAAEVEKAFGIEASNVPAISFTEDELKRARELGQMLVLEVPNAPDGSPLTMKGIHDLKGNELGEGKLLYDTDWYRAEDFFLTESVASKPTWKLMTRKPITGSLNVNYAKQTATIASYMTDHVYRDAEMPRVYQGALTEWRDRETELSKLINEDWQKAGKELANLQINQLLRPTAGQVLYAVTLDYEVNHNYLLPQVYAWTKSRSSRGSLVNVGPSAPYGVNVLGNRPDDWYGDIGVIVSRSGVTGS